jgi:cytochrome P450
MARKSEHPDLMYFATAEKKKGTEQKLPLKDMRDFSPFLMLAGGETTPTLLSGLIYCLLKNPDKLSRLIDEVRSNFQHGEEDITMERVFGLEYLNVCIDEALRIYPPIAAGVERVVPKGGAPIAGQSIPAKTIVLVPIYGTHHQPLNFARAGEFIPERWLPDADAEFSGDRKNACRPFSVGPHACFGQEYVFPCYMTLFPEYLMNVG